MKLVILVISSNLIFCIRDNVGRGKVHSVLQGQLEQHLWDEKLLQLKLLSIQKEGIKIKWGALARPNGANPT